MQCSESFPHIINTSQHIFQLFLLHPQGIQIITGAIYKEKMHVSNWKAVFTRGAGISDFMPLLYGTAQTA